MITKHEYIFYIYLSLILVGHFEKIKNKKIKIKK